MQIVQLNTYCMLGREKLEYFAYCALLKFLRIDANKFRS